MHRIHNGDKGKIEVITGCMFSGKTEELMRRIRRAEIAEQDVVLFKPQVDDRYSEDCVNTHTGEQREAYVVDESHPKEILNNVDTQEVVAIDEANFFEESLVETCQELAETGRRVIVNGLDQTFRGTPFKPLPDLMALAEDVEKLTAICATCGGEATRTQRISNGEPAHVDEPVLVVGGEDEYEARCRNCHEIRDD